MSEFTKLALRRQTCRAFADRPVEHDKIADCVEAARIAPSGCNAQPWSFVIAESPESVAKVAVAAQQLGANAYAAGAKAFVVFVEEHAELMPAIAKVMDSQYFANSDLGAAIAYLCLEAEAQGLGSLQIGIFDRNSLYEILGIPKTKRIAALVALGYAVDATVRPKIRKPMEAVARFV